MKLDLVIPKEQIDAAYEKQIKQQEKEIKSLKTKLANRDKKISQLQRDMKHWEQKVELLQKQTKVADINVEMVRFFNAFNTHIENYIYNRETY